MVMIFYFGKECCTKNKNVVYKKYSRKEKYDNKSTKTKENRKNENKKNKLKG